MLLTNAKYVVAALTLGSLLTSCAGGSPATTPPNSTTIPNSTTATPSHVAPALGCPCLYDANPYTHHFPMGSVTVYPENTFGDPAPIQEIGGATTGLNVPSDVAVDSSRNIYVANQGVNTVLVYAAGATGDVAPMLTITGSKTGLASPFGVAVNPVNGNLFVANRVGGTSTNGSVTIYSPGSNGNVSPIGTLAGSKTGLNGPSSLVLDGQGNIYVPNTYGNTVTIYAAGSKGNAAPVATIGGYNTQLEGPYQVALDSKSNIYVANYYKPQSITVYAAGANGNVAPIRTIAGQATLLNGPDGVALDKRGRLYVANYLDKRILIFHPGANGNVAPHHEIRARSGVVCPSGLTIF